MLNTAQPDVVLNAGSKIAKGERNNYKSGCSFNTNGNACSIFEHAEKYNAADKVTG